MASMPFYDIACTVHVQARLSTATLAAYLEKSPAKIIAPFSHYQSWVMNSCNCKTILGCQRRIKAFVGYQRRIKAIIGCQVDFACKGSRDEPLSIMLARVACACSICNQFSDWQAARRNLFSAVGEQARCREPRFGEGRNMVAWSRSGERRAKPARKTNGSCPSRRHGGSPGHVGAVYGEDSHSGCPATALPPRAGSAMAETVTETYLGATVRWPQPF